MGEGRDYQRILGREVVSTFCSVRLEVRIATEKVPEKEKWDRVGCCGGSRECLGGVQVIVLCSVDAQGYQRQSCLGQ